MSRRGAGAADLLDDARARASGLLLRLRREALSRRQPAAATRTIFRERHRPRAADRGRRPAVVTRHAGVILPLFSRRVGEELGHRRARRSRRRSASGSHAAGFDRLMLLPLGTMAPGRSSPYSAASAMAIDPIYIALDDGRRLRARGRRRRAVGGGDRARARRRARERRRVAYAPCGARRSKRSTSRSTSFLRDEWEALTARAAALAAYIARERWWLDDYALFQAIARRRGHGRLARLAARRCAIASRARSTKRGGSSRARCCGSSTCNGSPRRSGRRRARRRARAASRSSATCRSSSRPTAPTCGRGAASSCSTSRSACRPTRSAPPARTGGCRRTAGTSSPRTDFAWMRQRARRMAALYDGVRVDHLVGLLPHVRPHGRGARRSSIPPTSRRRRGRARQSCASFSRRGAEILAEDLGVGAGLRARVAGAARRARAARCCDGSAHWHDARRSRSSIRRRIRRSRSR